MAENDSTIRAPARREKYPALAFIMRNVDEAPEIACTRYLQDAAKQASETALCLALVCQVGPDTAIVSALREHYHAIDFLFSPAPEKTYPFLAPCMFFAWETTSSWSDWNPASHWTGEKLAEMQQQA